VLPLHTRAAPPKTDMQPSLLLPPFHLFFFFLLFAQILFLQQHQEGAESII
jgi:hypothetical protein